MNGRLRKFGLAGLVVGGTLLFGIGFAGAQSPSGGDGGSTPSRLEHTSPADVMIGGSAGSGGCHGDGGVTGSVVSSLDL
jgi:hypothetical protein